MEFNLAHVYHIKFKVDLREKQRIRVFYIFYMFHKYVKRLHLSIRANILNQMMKVTLIKMTKLKELRQIFLQCNVL
jgi:hypothetical protein